MAEAAEQSKNLCFKWGNHESHIPEVARQLLLEECMIDLTICTEGRKIYAHKIVLCACSTLFQELLSQANDEHSTIILSNISAEDMKSIVEFCYNGEARIPVENINSILEAAHFLKIYGLMEIEGVEESESGKEILGDTFQDDPLNDAEEEPDKISDEKNKLTKKKLLTKKDYTEENLTAAVNDVKNGKSLVDAALKNNVPRSTLYMRAKSLGIQMSCVRNEYPPECMKGAIEAVIAGSSLQQAADNFGIPKTVLWRRIQKEGYQIYRHDYRKSYDPEKREAAKRALERGENLTKVSQEYKIPKTTLFRDKVRLVDEGKLPSSYWKKRKCNGEDLKRSRLEEAISACKDGKMSQAAAAVKYDIPKTTIWRHLQMENKRQGAKNSLNLHQNKKNVSKPQRQKAPSIIKKHKLESSDKNADTQELGENNFETYCGDSLEIPITYIDDGGLPENSVIILTGDSGQELNISNVKTIAIEDGCEEFSSDIEMIEDETLCSPKS